MNSEYPAADQIREVLIHDHYLSQKDIEICLEFDILSLAGLPYCDNMLELHEAFKAEYGREDVMNASQQALRRTAL